MAQKVVTITSGQTIWDVALQYGYAGKIYELIQLNISKIPNIIFQDLTGLEIVYEDQGTYIAEYFSKKKVVIATKTPLEDDNFRITEEEDIRALENLDDRIIE